MKPILFVLLISIMCSVEMLASNPCQVSIIKVHCSGGTQFLRGSTVGVDVDVTYVFDFANRVMTQTDETGQIYYKLSAYTCKEDCAGDIVYEFDAINDQYVYPIRLHWKQYEVAYIIKDFATPHCCVEGEYDMGIDCEFVDQLQVDGYDYIL